jgi:excisionase family DNA binding protein
MMADQLLDSDRWLTLGEAAALLQVHPTTLRRWADNGEVPFMLTPGGHRRFSATELVHFAHSRQGSRRLDSVEETWATQALVQTRKEIVGHSLPWLTRFPEEDRQRNRLLGQRLLGLMLRYLAAAEEDPAIVQDARAIGHEYGRIARGNGLPLTVALQASMFFRDSLVEAALHLPESAPIRPEASMRLMRRINTLLNAVQLAVAEVYDGSDNDSLPGT